jgi:hypothetical protein
VSVYERLEALNIALPDYWANLVRLGSLANAVCNICITSELPVIASTSAPRYPLLRKLRIPCNRKDQLSAGVEGRNVH